MSISVKIRVQPKPIDDVLQRGYPIRSYSFIYSVMVHGIIIALLTVVSSLPASSPRPVYNELILPQNRKVFFYDLRKALPDVAPVENVGHSVSPHGIRLSRQAIVASSPKPLSTTQSIFVPVPKIQLQQDVPAPDLVARTASSLPALPPPPKPPPATPKAFLPPPINRQPKLPVQVPAVDALAPAINSPATPAPPVTSNSMSSISRIAAPRPEAPPVPTTSPGNANIDVAIANLDPPKNSLRTLPEGERPAQFSKAPNQGQAASGDAAPSALRVPNLSIRNSGNEIKVPENKPTGKPILYAERVHSAPQSTLSVPLRAATRTIPPAVDARFRGRNVYAIVVPIENMPVYGGDWIVWFAEHTPTPGETPLIYAPMPFRKLEPVEETSGSVRLRQRIQLAATVGKDGKLTNIALVSTATSAAEHAATQDLAAWEFKPAIRNGVTVDVDIVIEIPFNLALPSAVNATP
jgi:hypothetical protein